MEGGNHLDYIALATQLLDSMQALHKFKPQKRLNPALLCEALGGETPRIARTRLLRRDGSEWE